MGLLLPHIFTVTLSNDMVTVVEERNGNHTGGGKRNEIRGFSGESRYRLFRLFHSLSFSKFAFITLTYAATFPDDYRVSKRHLQNFRRLLEKHHGKQPVVWRAETQKRGAIHYHLLFLDPPFIPIESLENDWHTAREEYGLETTRNSVDFKLPSRTADARLVAHYVGKYLSKSPETNGDELPPAIGRVWGKWNIEEPPCVKIKLYEVEKKQLDVMILGEQEQRGWKPYSLDSYTCFGSQMGSGQYQQQVMSMLEKVLAPRRRTERRRVTNST